MEHVMWNTRIHLQMPGKMKLTGVNVQRQQFQQRLTVTLLYITSPMQMSTINTSNRSTDGHDCHQWRERIIIKSIFDCLGNTDQRLQ